MKKILYSIAVIGLLVLGVSAKKADDKTVARPNFTGSWERVKPRSLQMTDDGGRKIWRVSYGK